MPSIESNLTSIAESLKIIATYLTTTQNVQSTPTAQVNTPSAPAAPSAPTLVAAPVVTVSPVAVQSVMPPAPVFTDVAPVVAAPVVTAAEAPAAFPSKEVMTEFVINSYRKLGPEKGAQIQGVLESLGYKNINDVVPAQWGALKAGIEAIK